MNNQFVRVTTSDYYGEWDSVGGAFQGKSDRFPVHHGMKIRVRWKTGPITLERLVIRKGHDSAQIDMNNIPDCFETRTFVVTRNIGGLKVDVPLRGLQIAPAKG